MNYYESDNKTGKRVGLAASIAYIVLWGVLLLVIGFSTPEKEPGGGILINFGNVESASGMADPRENDSDPETTQEQRQTAPSSQQEEILTQETEEAPEVVKVVEKPKTKPSEVTNDGKNKPVETTPAEKPRVADPKLNFPGRTQGSTSSSEGNSEGAGNQGNLAGAPEGSHDGTGLGADGNSFDLKGRSVVGQLPKPNYGANVGGRVIVDITVDAAGAVVNAVYRAKGSTTNNTELVNAAINAARRSRFSKIDGDGLQTGTITYNFRLS